MYKTYSDGNPVTPPPSQIYMTVSSTVYGSSYDPDAFGPAFWFTLHNSATSYPNNPTEPIRINMEQLLRTLPILVPCITCKEHFYMFVSQSNLKSATESRENLFKFFVDAHNYVNMRNNKPTMSIAQAKKLYGFDREGVGSSIRITYR